MNAFRPLVSIVIPVFNGANYLATAIDSALAQTYTNVEVIVVDDGSTDGGATRELAASYGDRIHYVHKPNGGVSTALNAGIAAMKGDYFSWLSHDDIYLPGKLQRQVEFIADNPNVQAVAAGLEVIDDNGKVTGDWSSKEIRVIRNGRDVMDNWVYGCSLLIHKKVFERSGGFNEQNRTVQDLEMWLKMVHEGAWITMLPDVLCQWRHHGESDSFRLRGAHFDEVDAFLARIAASYPLEFFSNTEDGMTPREKLSTYGWFAEQALRRGSPRRAHAFFKSALATYPNILDRSFWRVLRRYVASHRAANQVR
ncbi:MAG TPA: glycosyltransferase [Ramlibacter sp.]|nr:glycosyltransferase [Ramlibacter sp.]